MAELFFAANKTDRRAQRQRVKEGCADHGREANRNRDEEKRMSVLHVPCRSIGYEKQSLRLTAVMIL
jgi:hypothetical protein